MDHVQRAGAEQRQPVDFWIGSGVGEEQALPEVGGRREVEGKPWGVSLGFFYFHPVGSDVPSDHGENLGL